MLKSNLARTMAGRLTLAALLGLCPLALFAGAARQSNPILNGIVVRPSDRPTFPAGGPLELCFSLADYRYSGPANEQEYMVFVVVPEGPGRIQAKNLVPSQVAIFGATGSDQLNLKRCHQMKVPPHEGTYVIYSLVEPYFTPEKLFGPETTNATLETISPPARARLLSHIDGNQWAFYPLARFQAAKSTTEPAPPTYVTTLSLNGRVPSVQEEIKPGLSDKPAVFTWATRPAGGQIEYRFRTYPDEVDWSPWSTTKQWSIAYLPVGTHVFQLEPRFLDAEGHPRALPIAYYQFFLERPFVAAPTKGLGNGETPPSTPLTIQYSDSQALVIAIPKFSAFPDLPFVSADAEAMKAVLEKRGFQVAAPTSVVTHQAVLERVNDFLRQTTPDSRVVVYLSTHGFVDPDSKKDNYFATQDCDPRQPSATCISADYLEHEIKKMLEGHEIRHFLLVVDACASGMGTVTKSYAFPEAGTLRMGAHVVTAGTADEEARASEDGKMSVFTKYLVKGLEGDANTYDDGVITLSELLTYVRWNVARETQAAQTPTMGRLRGSGEMIFPIKP